MKKLLKITSNIRNCKYQWNSHLNLEFFQQTIETFLPTMMQNGKGHVVCVCSMCGIYGVSQKVAYCSSKFAVRGRGIFNWNIIIF